MQYLKIFYIFLLIPTSVFAQGPSVHVLWHSDDSARITFNCSPVYSDDMRPSKTEIECESTTTFFSKQEEPVDFEDKWQTEMANSEITKMFNAAGQIRKTQTSLLEQICDNKLIEVMRFSLGFPAKQKKFELTDKEAEETAANIAALQPKPLFDANETSRAVINFCNQPSLNTFKEIVRSEFDKSTRTCQIFNQSTNERFSKINENLWISKNEGGGSLDRCERMTISTFRKPEGGQMWDWEFEFRTIVLNKEGESILGVSCAEIEANGTDLYTNRSNPVFLGCDYFAY